MVRMRAQPLVRPLKVEEVLLGGQPRRGGLPGRVGDVLVQPVQAHGRGGRHKRAHPVLMGSPRAPASPRRHAVAQDVRAVDAELIRRCRAQPCRWFFSAGRALRANPTEAGRQLRQSLRSGPAADCASSTYSPVRRSGDTRIPETR